MSTKLPWVRNFYEEWIMDFSGTSAAEKATYMTLTALMYRAQEPIWEEITTLARRIGCSVNALNKTLDLLLRKGKIIRLEDGRLWSQQVEEELKDCNDNLNKRSEKAIKAANTRRNKRQDNSSRDYDEIMVESSQSHDDDMMTSSRQHINNNIYKKTNTIVLSKKENASEDLATEVSVQSETTDDAVEQQLDHDTPSSENQSSVSQQKSTEKKTKRSRSERGCRLPHDFEPDLEYAIDKGLTHDEASLEFEKFKNYWLAKSGQGAIKKDWKLTWYNWVISDYGLLAQKAKLEKEKQNGRYGNYSQRQKSFTERLTESFESFRHDFSSGDDHEEDQSRVSIDLQEWERIDEAGGRKSLGCLQPSTEIVQCESFG
ncbi:DUF1376 domain-containing protein [Bartonella schoenbuchensis]|uniref:Phage related protein n=1 Tax=Bartonella schoenbuchensis m07a TaxID=1094496 RepID=N6UEB7_9HYPH|nr:DUF1376 domain-containing protein [Bartonella schoenbuchensis]ENN90909.1 hypothetical protein m07a_09100 [Bartonella schoenbuchensis m07a]